MKTVLITGTSRGIGRETALAFGRAGHQIFATMRNLENGAELMRYSKQESLPISIHQLDVDSDESVAQCIQEIASDHGPIDVLVNNAGFGQPGSVEEVPIAEFKALMETNYFGALRCIKAVLPNMRKNKSGCIINISSISGKIACTPMGPYSASKFALEAITEALAQEVKPFNIRVSVVEPGIIDTEAAVRCSLMINSLYPQVRRFARLFAEALKTPTPASLVADKILEIAESGTWQLKHPVGPDAVPFINWRASMNDEQWVDWNAQEDTDWYDAVEATFGMNCRPEKLEKEK
ncbi:SDR family oxidoreductase [Cyclobacterium jeungdonense]|uniref:SDR family oxidoreductase n=1 Tax=Cyclobacterium jeungdonense TaxID=708087 RepID=A0ABT8C0G3_9BACT|nr:SDR family oxidoreductase [Cyclobacterium jeungdonense]MDN3686288.1 SDR family oxidoreductase [Cyclobacterium jeungdonense]